MRSCRTAYAHIALALLVVVALAAPRPANRRAPTSTTVLDETLNGHPVTLDGSGALVSWVSPQGAAYDQVMSLAWNFLLNGVQIEENGLKTYYTYSTVDPDTLTPAFWPHNPACLYADLTESGLSYYAYSGNDAVTGLVQRLLDYHLAHGMTPSNWSWASVPFASGDPGDTEYRGSHLGDVTGSGDGFGVIEPDKVGALGYAFLRFYEFSGDVRYRAAALNCANALVLHIRAGDDTHSPWPFRVYACNNVVREEYTASVISQIRLFDELIRLGLGNPASYQAARQTAWTWLMIYPVTNNNWSNYFEDIGISTDLGNFNQITALEAARYILENPQSDPGWRTDVPKIIGWVEDTFGTAQYGANAIGEQIIYNFAMGSHTSRYASVNALWYEMTGDGAAKEKAYRSFNWATYMCCTDGRVIVGPEVYQIWWTDGYGDYIRHFLVGLGSIPEWSPPQQDHLLRSTSVVQDIAYLPGEVDYETSDGIATEVLRLSFTPAMITANGEELPQRMDLDQPGWTYDSSLGVLRIRHVGSTQIRVIGGASTMSRTPTPAAAVRSNPSQKVVGKSTPPPRRLRNRPQRRGR
jgi:hypothetical protein